MAEPVGLSARHVSVDVPQKVKRIVNATFRSYFASLVLRVAEVWEWPCL